jgi:ATP-dependent DNA ligase
LNENANLGSSFGVNAHEFSTWITSRTMARLLFEQIVKMDLEGMVCKRKNSPYRATEKPSPHWIKVKNRRYSQAEGREELFDRSLR